MQIEDNLLKLNVDLYGKMEPLTDTLSKSRVRIFYRGLNRNRTFISDDFANQLIASLPYAPIKGIFDKEDIDFGDHGEKNSDGRIYGLITANPNFAWEKHLDADGVEREYACADVILYTALYPEAKLIPGKSQSMEIHRNGLEGEWKIWNEDSRPYFHFLKGHLLGLQTLGDEIEPCFEGAAFYTLSTKELVEYAKKSNKKEESKMEKNIFNLPDNQTCELLFDALNKENNSNIICDICDEYAIVYDTNCKNYKYICYTKEDNLITIGEITDCYIVNVNSTDFNALNEMKKMGTYSEVYEKIKEQKNQLDTSLTEKNSLRDQLTAANQQIEEFEKTEKNDEITKKLQEEIEEYKKQILEKDTEIFRLNQLNSDIANEKSELESYKQAVDIEKKNSIIKEFSKFLSEEQITNLNSKMNDFSIEDFKKEVCFEAYNTNSSIFNKKEEAPDLIYKNTNKNMQEGVFKLLDKHRNKNKGGNK